MGCYHATVPTAATPSAQVIENQWAHGFVFGLVPPKTVETQAGCGSKRVAKVETHVSFLNALASGITFSSYTPMTIKVTCAQ